MRKNLLPFLLWLIAISLHAQEEQIFKFDHTIPSAAFGDERQISVYLPPDYYKRPDQKYTLTFVLDGHFDPFIDFAAASIGYNSYMHKYIPTIVVGVHAKARGWEFSVPLTEEEKEEYKGGRAPELQQHFKQEIFPLVDSLYQRTLPFRSIIGHSSGGKFVLYTLFSEEKDLFDAYIGISPALRPGEHSILEDASARLAAGEKFPKFLYCSVGTVGEREELFGGAINQLDSILKVYPQHDLIWRNSVFKGMDHWTCVGPTFNSSMVELTKAFRIDEEMLYEFANSEKQTMTQQIKAFYKKQKEAYGFISIPSARYLYRMSWNLYGEDEPQEAIDLLSWALIHHPQDYRLTKTKAKMLFRTEKYAQAQNIFVDCLSLLNKEKANWDAEEFGEQKKYLEGKIAESKKALAD